MKAALFIISIYIVAVTSASSNSRVLKRKDENQERKRRNRGRGKVVEHTDGEEILKGTSGSPRDGTIPQMKTVRGDRKHKTEEELIIEEIVIEKRIKHEERKKEKAMKRHKREDSELEDEAIADAVVDGAIVVAATNTTTEIEESGHGKHIKLEPSSTSYAQQVQKAYGGPVEKEKRGKKGPDPVMNKHGPPRPRGKEEEEKELALQQLQNSSSMLRPTFLLASVVFVLFAL